MSKGQSSLEFLTIFGISFLIIVVMGGLFYSYSMGAKDTLDKQHLEKSALELIQNIEKIYFQGSGNRITMSFSMPEGINNMYIQHWEDHPMPGGENASFDMLVFNYTIGGMEVLHDFMPNELYIRFNCTMNCTSIGNRTYFNESHYSPGSKRIRIESRGDFVNLQFIQ